MCNLCHKKIHVTFRISDNDNEDSAKMLRHLELIDDEASEFGVVMVKIEDKLMAKKYGHRNPPGLGFFRQGNYIKYDGKLLNLSQIKLNHILIKLLCLIQGITLMMKRSSTG